MKHSQDMGKRERLERAARRGEKKAKDRERLRILLMLQRGGRIR